MKSNKHMEVAGFFFVPHDQKQTDWTGEILDPKTGELVKEPSMTKQSFVAECDINNIVRDFTVTGQIQHINEHAAKGQFVDLPDNLDYQEAVEIARLGNNAFSVLPAQLRARFDNDPEKFLMFMADPANQEEMIKLGLATDTRPPPAVAEQSGPKAAQTEPTPQKGS